MALYVLGKYLDGFIEGLGVKKLGKKHGKMVLQAIRFAGAAIESRRKPDSEELVRHAEAMSQAIRGLEDYRSNSQALKNGSAQLRLMLIEEGIPDAEAEIICKNVEDAVWRQ